ASVWGHGLVRFLILSTIIIDVRLQTERQLFGIKTKTKVTVRVLWYQSQWHQRCHLTKPFVYVYDTDSKINKQHFEYLGDKTTNCTLQIRDAQERDEATFCFRMEINHTELDFTESRGVTVRVVDGTKMKIINSSDHKKLSTGETVTLLCTSAHTFHQLEVTWFKDGHALSGTDPSLHLGPLTAEDSGNYTCALKTNLATLSEPYSLQVEAEEIKLDKLTAVRLVLFAAHTLLIIIVASVLIKGTFLTVVICFLLLFQSTVPVKGLDNHLTGTVSLQSRFSRMNFGVLGESG
uniref:Ig-like domain-containing protein n=1 Tax=Amphilophus citrinellus TaxID=61819 RepID=A0A3Q0S8F4_AMPCI